MFCQNCGKENKEKANYCISCGSKIIKNSSAKDNFSESENKNISGEKINNAMQIGNIESYMKQLNITPMENFIYGYIEPGFTSFLFLGSLSMLADMKNFIIVFSPKEIILIGLTMGSNFADTNVRIPKEDIESFEVKKGVIQYKIHLKVTGTKKIILKVSKIIIGKEWQKENLSSLIANNWYQS